MPITEGKQACETNSELALLDYLNTVPQLQALGPRTYQALVDKEKKQIGILAKSMGEAIRCNTGIQRMSFTITLEMIGAGIAVISDEMNQTWAQIIALVYSTNIEAQLTSPTRGVMCYPKSCKRGLDTKANVGNKFVRSITFEAMMVEM